MPLIHAESLEQAGLRLLAGEKQVRPPTPACRQKAVPPFPIQEPLKQPTAAVRQKARTSIPDTKTFETACV
jgi:hypothetical protein